MGTNNNPSYGVGIANIQARPEEHEALLLRQGQVTRIMQAKKCPCIKHGHADLYCNLCNGEGFTLSFQKRYLIVDENSPHDGSFSVYPFWNPIKKVYKVEKVNHISQGGNVEYPVTDFTDSIINIDPPNVGDCPPKAYEKLRVTYEYDLCNYVVDENCTHDGSYYLSTINTVMEIQNSSNPFEIHGDLNEVTRVRNSTKDVIYKVKDFFKQTIVIDDENGSVEAPLETDVLEVDYSYVTHPQVGTGRLTMKNNVTKNFEDIKEGDVQGIFPAGYDLNKSDIITFLTPRVRAEDIIKRGSKINDEIPQFDIAKINDPIIDEDGNKYYEGEHFRLERYNDLVWTGAVKPASGKKYTVSYLYKPSFRVYKDNNDLMTNENKYFPHLLHLRFMNRFNKNDIVTSKWQ